MISILLGKIRRFYLSHFRRKFVREMHALREGSCHRCGRCCMIGGIVCPFLGRRDDGTYYCRIYRIRPLQCRTFPITQADIEEARCPGFRFRDH